MPSTLQPPTNEQVSSDDHNLIVIGFIFHTTTPGKTGVVRFSSGLRHLPERTPVRDILLDRAERQPT
jgi:hypothetical protein